MGVNFFLEGASQNIFSLDFLCPLNGFDSILLLFGSLEALWPHDYTKKKTVGYIILEFEMLGWI